MLLTKQEIQDIHLATGDIYELAEAIERAVLAQAGERESIYMWRLEDDGWMECTKEWFDGPMSQGYEKRILYDHPLPAQAIPDGYVHVDDVIQLCKDFSSRTGSVYIGDVEAAISGLSASPKP